MIIGLVESFIYCLLIYLFFFEFSDFKRDFLTMNLQPFLIIVGIMALKYGVYISLETVLIASLFYIFAYCKSGNDIVVFFLDYQSYKFVLMFFFVALILGKFSDKYHKKMIELKENKKIIEEKYEKQKEKNVELININKRLKTRIINSRESILTLHEMIVSIFKMKIEEIFTQSLKILTQFLGADVVSIYLYNKERNILRARIKVGKSKIENFFLVEKEKYFEDVIKNKKVIEVKSERNNTPLYVAPILKNGEVLGVINIERLKYHNKEKYTFELLKIISEWIDNALIEAIEKEKIEKEKNRFRDTMIFNIEYFNYIFLEDKKRKKIFGANFIAMESENPGLTSKELNERIKGKIRDVDLVGMNEKIIRFLFVNADKESKKLLFKKVKNFIPEADFYEI